MSALPRIAELPLTGVRVLEFAHTIMGPCCGMILGDLGAEVIKVEPPDGDRTRRLRGFGSGYFGFFNRNKKSIAVDVREQAGMEIVRRLLARADVVVENFAPGTMAKNGLAYDDVRSINDRIVYCSLKGFLAGPYQHRAALDEVVQMMGGLAYMTGPPGRPLRAGASVIDIMGGTYGAFAVMIALQQRARTNKGRLVESGLFETAAFLMGQHLAYAAQTDRPIPPMPERESAWAIYELFDAADGAQIFIGVTSDQQWDRFCRVFDLPDLGSDERLRTNNDRIAARAWLVPRLCEVFRSLTRAEILHRAEAANIAYAPVARPEDLFEDPHLNAGETLVPTTLPHGIRTKLPQLPIRLDGKGFGLRADPPHVGEHTRPILRDLGYRDGEIEALRQQTIVASHEPTEIAAREVRAGSDGA